MSNSVVAGGWLGDLPPSIRAWGILIGAVGIPGVISLLSMWMFFTIIPSIKDAQFAQNLQLQHHQEEATRTSGEQKALLEKILLTQQIICSQGEKTIEGKQRCFGN